MVASSLSARSQNQSEDIAREEKPASDFLMLQLSYDSWLDKPDSIKTKGFSRGLNLYLCYDFPIKGSKFSFATGLGISSSHIFLDNMELVNVDTGGLGVRFVPETRNYKRYKLSTSYLDMPLELRYYGNKLNRNKGFKFAIGAKVGTLIDAKTRAIDETNGKSTVKVRNNTFYSRWRLAGTLRIGYGNVSLFSSINATPLFEPDNGPDMLPFSIGISLSGL